MAQRKGKTASQTPAKFVRPSSSKGDTKAAATRPLAKKKTAAKAAQKPTSAKERAAAELAARLAAPLADCAALAGEPALHWPPEAMRLGFAVKVMGEPDLKSNDTRRWQAGPHLRISLGYLCGMFAYLRRQRIHMYRMGSDLSPYATHPGLPQFHGMVRECGAELAQVGRLARAADIRLSFHPSQFIVLNSESEELTRRSMWDLDVQAEILDRMECGPEARLVIHTGGAYGDRASGCARWCATWKRLGEPVRRRLVLENDDLRYSAADVLRIHEETGVPLVFDYQHFWCFNPERLELLPTLARMLATWPAGVRPKIHFSCARTEMRELKRKNRTSGKQETVLQPPVWTGHADYNNPFETLMFLRSIAHLQTDVMLEAKAKDLSLMRLRNDMLRYAPELAPRYNIAPDEARNREPEEIVEEDE